MSGVESPVVLEEWLAARLVLQGIDFQRYRTHRGHQGAPFGETMLDRGRMIRPSVHRVLLPASQLHIVVQQLDWSRPRTVFRDVGHGVFRYHRSRTSPV